MEQAYHKCTSLCARREYCIDDLRRKLVQWGVGDEEIAKVIDQLIIEKYLDERRYVAYYVRDKFRFNKWGREKIRAHLQHKRIDAETISQGLATLDDDEYVELLKHLLSEKNRRLSESCPYKRKSALIRYAVSKGFEYALVSDFVNLVIKRCD